jgi:hypothetical protein
MATHARPAFANSPQLIGGHAIQPMMSGDVIQQWPSWDEVKTYGYNALVSLQSIGGIATAIASALQAQGLGWGIPAIIGAAPAICKMIIDRCSRENWSFQDGTAYSAGAVFADLASQVASIGVPAIMSIAQATPSAAAITVGTLTAILAAVSWVVMSIYTDKYEMWEKKLGKAVAACYRQKMGYESL